MARILIVDDDPDFVEVIRLLLGSKGYQVDSASNVELALRSMSEHAPGLVILDMMICFVMDGYTIAREMRVSPAWKDIPILVVSSFTEAQCASMHPRTERLAVDGWITKPVNPEKLFQQVGSLLTER